MIGQALSRIAGALADGARKVKADYHTNFVLPVEQYAAREAEERRAKDEATLYWQRRYQERKGRK